MFIFSDDANIEEQNYDMSKAEALGANRVFHRSLPQQFQILDPFGTVNIDLFRDVNNDPPKIRWRGKGEYYILCIVLINGEMVGYTYFDDNLTQLKKLNIINSITTISFKNFKR